MGAVRRLLLLETIIVGAGSCLLLPLVDQDERRFQGIQSGSEILILPARDLLRLDAIARNRDLGGAQLLPQELVRFKKFDARAFVR